MADITYLFGALDRSISWKQDLVYFFDGKTTNQILSSVQTFNNDKEAATVFFKALMEPLDGVVLHPHFIHLHWRVKANYPTTFLVNKDFLEHFCQQIFFSKKNLSCSYQICSGPILELLSSLCLVYLVKEAVNIFALPSQVPGGRWEREEAIEFKFLVSPLFAASMLCHQSPSVSNNLNIATKHFAVFVIFIAISCFTWPDLFLLACHARFCPPIYFLLCQFWSWLKSLWQL